jgi:hypothetical protein
MGLLAQVFRLSGSTHGRPPILLFESSRSGTHGTKPHHQPPSAWQVSFGLEKNQTFLIMVKLLSALPCPE